MTQPTFSLEKIRWAARADAINSVTTQQAGANPGATKTSAQDAHPAAQLNGHPPRTTRHQTRNASAVLQPTQRKNESRAAQAREAAGFTIEEAARRARIGTTYLRRIETRGGASWVLALRLASIYQCRCDVFLYPTFPTGAKPDTTALPVVASHPNRRHPHPTNAFTRSTQHTRRGGER